MNRPEKTFGPGPDTLLCDGRPVAPVAVVEDSAARGRGLLGTDAVVGALWITRCPSVHMMGMRYPIDAAVVDRDGLVLQVRTLRPWTGATWPRRGASATIEAAAGAMAGWGVRPGVRLAYERRLFVAPSRAPGRLPAIEFSMSSPTFDDSSPVEGDDTGAPTEPQEFGSLSIEDDPTGTVDPAELADTANESDQDVR